MGNLKVECLTLGVCQTNCYYIHREDSREVIFFDPADKGNFLYETLQEKEFQIKAILLTHGHFDHIWGVEELRERSGAEVYAYEGEEKLCQDPALNVSAAVGRSCGITPDHLFRDGAPTFQILTAELTLMMKRATAEVNP